MSASMIRRIEAKCFLNFADALSARVIQVKGLHRCAAHSGQSSDVIAIKPEEF